jgi:L-ascorbate metabolism protein UlaG (beta-lactamase superfamily)
MIVKWFGHATFLVTASGKRIYIDPYAGDYSEPVDIILISHGHRDHCDLEKLAAVRTADTVIVTSADCARNLDGNIVVMAPGERREFDGVTVEAVEAYNIVRFRSPGVPFHPKGTQIAFVVEAEGKRVYHAGDTDFIPEMKALNDIDIALLPIMGRATMDVDEAVDAAVAINPKIAIPMHRRGASATEFKENVEARSSVTVHAIAEGDEVDP